METIEKRRGLMQLLIGALIILGITNGITLYLLLNEKHEKIVVITEKASLQDEYQSVLDSLDAKRAEIGMLRGKNADLDKQIAEREKMIDDQKAELQDMHEKNTLTAAQLSKARGQIGRYEVSIASMQKQIEEYAEQTKQLTTEKTQLTEDLGCEKETTQALTEVNTKRS